MKKCLIIILIFLTATVGFAGEPGREFSLPFNKANFDVANKPVKYTQWDVWYLNQMKNPTNTFWADRVADVDSNYIKFEKEYQNIIEFVNGYRKSKGMTELKYSRKVSLQCELSQYYHERNGIVESNCWTAITHTLNSQLFYGMIERGKLVDKNVTFEKNVDFRGEIVTGCSTESGLRNKYSPEALAYYQKYKMILKFLESPAHHSAILDYDLNYIGFSVKQIGCSYHIIIAFGRDKNVVNERKPEFAPYMGDDQYSNYYGFDKPYYKEAKIKYDAFFMSIWKQQKVEVAYKAF